MLKHIAKTFIILTALFTNAVYAIDSEYKNSLNKIELTKVDGDYYTINLYTQNRYSEPVRVIKKSDLNYYILLPETKNAASKTILTTPDIRNITTAAYPYAGQDVNNGYTKININTSKPITFDINIKNSTQTKSQQNQDNAMALNSQPLNASKQEAQKKNLNNQIQNPKTQYQQTTQSVKGEVKKQNTFVEAKKQTNTPLEENTKKNIKKQAPQKETLQKEVAQKATPKKTALKEPTKQISIPQKKENALKSSETKISKEPPSQIKTTKDSFNKSLEQKNSPKTIVLVQKAAKIEDLIQQDAEKTKKEKSNSKQEALTPEFFEGSDDAELGEVEEIDTSDDITQQAAKDYSEVMIEDSGIFESVKLPKGAFEPDIKLKLDKMAERLKYKAMQYNLEPWHLALIAFALIFGIIAILSLAVRNSRKNKNSNDIKLKRKKDLFEERKVKKYEPIRPVKKIEKTQEKPAPSIMETVEQTSQQQQAPKPAGEYFKFDEYVNQMGFCSPANPDIVKKFDLQERCVNNNNKNSKVEPYQDKYSKFQKSQNEHEYDIIRRIIKEETFSNVAQKELENVARQYDNENAKKAVKMMDTQKQPKVNSNTAAQTTNLASKVQKEEEKKKTNEPTMLSKVEIAPERGFMCILYNGNVNLMGYLFDDVFALYNFNQQKLNNYEIKYRLSEKTGDNASFIVKVDSTKMLVKVTKNSMRLEVVM